MEKVKGSKEAGNAKDIKLIAVTKTVEQKDSEDYR